MYYFMVTDYLYQEKVRWHTAAVLFLCCSLTTGKPLADNYCDINVSNIFAEYLAVIELAPTEVVYVCPGGQLNITCKTNASYMEWNVSVPQYNRSSRVVLSRFGTPQRTVQLWIDESTIFNISKHFDENLTLPLVSVMFANDVTLPINGTSIFCTEYQNLDSNLEVWITETLSTTLHIIGPGAPNYGRL